ncbi:peptidylprolyl isomerase [Alkalibacterium thalassium]|uniref:Foldase protein PrsA n=1 Tax=Alkalibacterium thalassium TaxID=426701 RepID=A0A1G8WB77_9LACT|nr:peptidylprolyl isomerase [Alkalibacterium thalassium]SDJ75478.1 foldase protein PrsA [Alkalibacterium thalassium]
MKKMLFGAVACSGLLLAGCASSPEVASTEAGRVREDELFERMKNEVTQSGMTYGEQMLQQILLEDILDHAYGDEVSDEDIDAELEKEAEPYGGLEEFEEMIAMQGMSLDDVRNSVRTSLQVRAAIQDHVEITDEEIEEAYENYTIDSTVAHILVEDLGLAEEIIDELNDGADFGELVAEHSMDTGTIESDGELVLEPGRFVPEFEEAAMELEEGEFTQEPVESQFGYHIIKLVEEGEKGTLEEERETIEAMLIDSYMQDQAVVQEAIGKLVRDANVQISDEDLTGAMQQFMEPAPEQQEMDQDMLDEPLEEGNGVEEDPESDEDADTDGDTESDSEEAEEDNE